MPVIIPKSVEIRLTPEECRAGVSAGLCCTVDLWQVVPIAGAAADPVSCQETLDDYPEDDPDDENYVEPEESDDDPEPFERLEFRHQDVVHVLVDGEVSRALPIDSLLWSLFDNLEAAGEDGLTVAQLIRSVSGWNPEMTNDPAVAMAVSRLRKFIRRNGLRYEIKCLEKAEKNNSKINFYVLARASPCRQTR